MKKIVYLCSIFALITACSNVKDPAPADGCITNNLSLELVSKTSASSCSSSDATFEVSVSGGSGDYTFSANGLDAQQSGSFSNVAPVLYSLKAVDNESGCEISLAVSISGTNGITISNIALTDAGCGTSEGMIVVTASGSGTLAYSLNGGSSQAENTFSNLDAGEYTITVSDNSGCELSSTVMVENGTEFAAVKSIIDQSCAVSGCHVAGTGRTDFTKNDNIVNSASQIKTRTGNNSMPPGTATISSQAKSDIACWVDDGANLN